MTPFRAMAISTVGTLAALAAVWVFTMVQVGRAVAPLDLAETEATQILTMWDAARSSAWAAGDVAALRELYVPGSRAGRRDVAALRRWNDSGLRVTQMRVDVLALEVVADPEPGQQPAEWTLRVTDRLSEAVVVGPGVRSAMDNDKASTRTVVLVEAASGWQVSSVS